jgi:hypothetical protein
LNYTSPKSFITVQQPYVALNENYYDRTPVVTTGAQFTCILKGPSGSRMLNLTSVRNLPYPDQGPTSLCTQLISILLPDGITSIFNQILLYSLLFILFHTTTETEVA